MLYMSVNKTVSGNQWGLLTLFKNIVQVRHALYMRSSNVLFPSNNIVNFATERVKCAWIAQEKAARCKVLAWGR